MNTKSFMKELNAIRESLLESLDNLDSLSSFTNVMQHSNLKENYERLSHDRIVINKPFEYKFVSAIVGSSSHGKTTILDEIFPNLSKRDWLVTANNDTTSQALRIEYASQSSESIEDVVVHSWNIDQMKNIFDSEYVKKQNEKDNIKVIYGDTAIKVDGTESSFKEKKETTKFPLTLSLSPFSQPYKVLPDQFSDKSFIEALTTKPIISKIRTDSILTNSGIPYNALQLRAVVKDICLKDSFEEIKNWTKDLSEDEISNLVFIDTPGLATSGSEKDGVLRHPLAVKSNQIVLELMKNDELDIIIHLVLCGKQSDFSILWEALEKNCGNIEMEDLSERLILAINGTNEYFTGKDMIRHVAQQEHFEISLDDNILLKMSPRGTIRPAKICFLDSKKYIETLTGSFLGSLKKSFKKDKENLYEMFYKKNKERMLSWLEPNTKSHMFLDNLNMLETFRENIEAICDPYDRGQGFLIRKVVELIKEKGHILLIKKYLFRSNLLDNCQKLLNILLTYYNSNGELNYEATKEAMKDCFSFLDDKNFYSIEEFCVAKIDKDIDKIVNSVNESNQDWIEKCFSETCEILFNRIIESSNVNNETTRIFSKFFHRQLKKWIEDWGYSISTMPLNERTKILLNHSIKIHVREIVFQCMTSQSLFEGLESLSQTNEDKGQIKNIIKKLQYAIKLGNDLCHKNGVNKNEYI